MDLGSLEDSPFLTCLGILLVHGLPCEFWGLSLYLHGLSRGLPADVSASAY